MADSIIADEGTMELLRQQMGLQQGGNNRILVKFSMEPEQDAEESKKAGRPIFKDREFITKMVPGDKDNVIFRPVRETDKVEFAQQYEAFKAKRIQPITGTLLESIPFMPRSQVLEFAALGVRTAEQLVGMSDSNAQKFIGFQQLKTRIQNFLDAAADAAPALRLQAELEKRDSQLANMQATIEEQMRLIKELQKMKGKKNEE